MFQMLTYYTVSIHYYLLPISSDKALNTEGRVVCGGVWGCLSNWLRQIHKFSKTLFFAWNVKFLIDNKYCPLFSLKCQAYWVHFQTNVCQIPSLKSQCFSAVLPSKSDVPWKKKKASLAHNSISPVLFLETTITLKVLKKCFPSHHTEY